MLNSAAPRAKSTEVSVTWFARIYLGIRSITRDIGHDDTEMRITNPLRECIAATSNQPSTH
jgi:hypothetical protein